MIRDQLDELYILKKRIFDFGQKNFLTPPINREKWLEKVKVDKVQYKPIISETVKAR